MHDELKGKPTEGIIDYGTGVVHDVPPDKRVITVPKRERFHGEEKTVGIYGNFVKLVYAAEYSADGTHSY